MTYIQIFILFVGLGFIYGGFEFYKQSRNWSAILFSIGGGLLYLIFFGAISKSDNVQDELQNFQETNIFEIAILPGKRGSLTKDTLLIYSKSEIERILASLSKTKDTMITAKNSDWSCVLSIQTKQHRNLTFKLSKEENRSILELYSKGEFGANLGSMESNDLGNIIEEIVVKHQEQQCENKNTIQIVK